MKKRVLAMLLASAMVAGSLAGCGGSSDKPEASTEDGKKQQKKVLQHRNGKLMMN